jgi:UDP-glucuronate 4-epimerase
VRALVTGAAGFIGSHLAEALVTRGDDVVALDRRPPGIKGARTFKADVLRAALPKVDVVFHLAGRPGVRQSWQGFDRYLEDNLLATQRVLEHARRTGARVVFASSSSVYGGPGRKPAPISPYGVTKLAVEHLARAYHEAYGVHAVGLRYFTVYGPRQRPDMAFHRFITAALDGTSVDVYGDGLQTRHFTYVADAVEATLLAAEAGPGVYDVPGPGAASVLEAITLIRQITERPLTVTYQPAAAGDPRETEPHGTLPAYEPRVELAEGLKAQVEYIRAGRDVAQAA